MSADAEGKPVGRWLHSRLMWVLLAIAGVLGVLCLWFAGFRLEQADPLFRGKPESAWIKSIKYWDDEQVKEWRALGEEGVQVLVRGLERANHPGERAYRQIYRRSPGFLAHRLPEPKRDSTRSSRMCMAALLSSLGNEAKGAMPMMIWLLNHDEDSSVREIVIGYFTSTEDEKCLLNQMSPKEKQQVLPALIRDIQNQQFWGLRNNAANALRWFPEQREVVMPILTNALHDPQPQVAVLAAKALNRIDPESARIAGVVAVLAAITHHPDDQIASRAIAVLRQVKFEPERVVPVLLVGMQSTNSLVACQAVWVLQWGTREYAAQADSIVPALQEACAWTNAVGRYARVAMDHWTNTAAGMQK